MKRSAWCALGCLLATASQGQEFAYRAELSATWGQAAYRVALPAEVQRGATRADLADLCVTNGAGETLPFAIISGGARVATVEEGVALPAFPVVRSASDTTERLELQVRRSADGSLLSIASASGPRSVGGTTPAYWLVDASRLTRPVRALTLVWQGEPSLSAALRVEASEDLAQWRTLAERAPLVDLRVGGQRLRQDRVEFAPASARYLRLTVDAQGGAVPDFSSVTAVTAGDRADPPWDRVTATGKGIGALEYAFDLGGAFTVERVDFRLPQQNALAPAEILVRDQPAAPWRPLARTVVYRLAPKAAGADDLRSPPTPLVPTAARYWLLRLDPHSGGVGAGEVRMEADYAVRHVVFVARGAAPFRIEYGRRATAGERARQGPAALALPALLPGYREGDEWRLPVAVAGAAVTRNPGAVEPTLATEFDIRKAMLWAVLVAAVLALGGIAYRLLRGAGPAA